MKYQLDIRANEGYGADQVRQSMTVADLKAMLEGLDDDAEIVTFDHNNRHGASWGKIVATELSEIYDEDDEEYEGETIEEELARIRG